MAGDFDPAREAGVRRGVGVPTVLIYFVVFWILLPAFLFAMGFRLDALVPVALGDSRVVDCLGWFLVLPGALIVILAVRQLWTQGKGLPISHLPPVALVRSGAYRLWRHPLYVGYTALFAGAAALVHSFWSLVFSTPLLLIGWIAYARLYEEPVLIRRFGNSYRFYRETTPMLVPKVLSRTLVRALHPLGDRPSRLTAARTDRATVGLLSWLRLQWRGEEDGTRVFFIKRGLFLYVLWIAAFEAFGRYASTLPTHDLTIPLDRRIPLIPIFIWPYLFCYVFVVVPGIVATDWHRVCRGFVSVLFANLTAFVVYFAYPVAFPKPEPAKGVAASFIRLEYAIDFHPGANNLPSLHVIFAWLICFVCLRQGLRRSVEYLLWGTALLITLSTMFVKQHILADVVTGILWAVVSWVTSGHYYARWLPENADAKQAFQTMARKLIPFCVTTLSLMLIFAVWR